MFQEIRIFKIFLQKVYAIGGMQNIILAQRWSGRKIWLKRLCQGLFVIFDFCQPEGHFVEYGCGMGWVVIVDVVDARRGRRALVREGLNFSNNFEIKLQFQLNDLKLLYKFSEIHTQNVHMFSFKDFAIS